MKMMTIATLAISALFMACGGADNGPGNSTAAAETETTVMATNEAQETATTTSPKFKDGITDANRGDRVGQVRLHGSVRGGAPIDMILYETEARNKSEIARTKITNGGEFDFISYRKK